MNKNKQIIKSIKPTCYWITGLSGAGKTTVGSIFTSLFAYSSQPTIFLDGDELRRIYSQIATDKRTRIELGYRNFRLCQCLIDQGFNVVLSAIGMYQELYDFAKNSLSSSCLIFLDVPIDELVRRDPKGIYAKASSGDLRDVAGVDMRVDLPEPEVKITWKENMDVQSTIDILLNELTLKNYITRSNNY